jgi:hypothetical protein
MFDETRRFYAIRRLQKIQDHFSAKYDKQIEDAQRKKADPEQIERITSEKYHEDVRIENAIDRENTYFILKMCRRYLIPLPVETDKVGPDWVITEFGPMLNRQTCLALLVAIRALREGRWREFERWITWAIALIGALTGLVAVLKK